MSDLDGGERTPWEFLRKDEKNRKTLFSATFHQNRQVNRAAPPLLSSFLLNISAQKCPIESWKPCSFLRNNKKDEKEQNCSKCLFLIHDFAQLTPLGPSI